MDKNAKKILNILLDKYEKSKSFNNENKVNQSFFIEPSKIFPKYSDDSEYEFFVDLNDSVNMIQKKELVKVLRQQNGVITKIILNVNEVDNIYSLLKRPSKKDDNEWLNNIWDKILSTLDMDMNEDANIYAEIIGKYIKEQKERIMKNKPITYYDNNRSEYSDLMIAIKHVILNNREVYIRDFSIRVFSDSKRMESLKAKVQSFLFEYGDYMEKEHVLEECGIVSMPTYVAIKGNGIIIIGNQQLNLSLLNCDISLSTESIKELKDIKILGNRIVTIENMTSFHDYQDKDDFVIYLGGFHNKVKREMLSFIYNKNKDKQYFHFGDIDAGGFYIFEHLCNKTGIDFQTLYMDTEVLEKYKSNWKEITQNDKKRIKQLIYRLEEKTLTEAKFIDYREVLYYMLENNCKLEQEVIKIIDFQSIL